MPIPPPLPSPLDLGPFSVAEARALGVPRSRLRRSDLVTPFRGIRATDAPRTLPELCEAYAPRLGAGQFFSHAAAAALWGMWVPRRILDHLTLDVMAVHPARPARLRGVTGHHAQAGTQTAMLDGLPVASATVVWRQLATRLTLDELIAAGDSLVRRKHPLCALADLEFAVAAHAGRPGAPRLARAMPQVRARADSPRETVIRLLLARAGLPEPEVNGLVSRPGERERFGDLVYRAHRVIAEYDGQQHWRSAQRIADDVERLEQLTRGGWTVIRIVAPHLADPEAVVGRVAAALRAGGWRGRLSRGQLWRLP
ncbi:MAG: DUF559 domain-containing protein [Salinibacterium sp.]|nr:DUF559 domain-containing protein [Salinibacterium sp.]